MTMTPFSHDLLQALANAMIEANEPRPRLLLSAAKVEVLRQRARSTPDAVDALARRVQQQSNQLPPTACPAESRLELDSRRRRSTHWTP